VSSGTREQSYLITSIRFKFFEKEHAMLLDKVAYFEALKTDRGIRSNEVSPKDEKDLF
jgi:hypothetical protein